MLALRPLLRQTRQRNWALSRNFLRVQHDLYGPHKEYFQNPNKPYYPDLQTPNPAHQGHNSPYVGPRFSRTRRFIRASLWALVFFNLGALTAEALLTWDYLQPPYEKGSEEEQEFQDEINELLDTCSLVESLREEGWKEEPVFVRQTEQDAPRSEHLLHQTLQSTQGITMKLFRHPSQHFTVLVFFPGFGCEGWPDVVHGGAISSVMLEAAQKHLEGTQHFISQEMTETSIDFRAPVKPGAVYAVLCNPSAPHVFFTGGETDDYKMYLVTDITLVQTERAPKIDFDTHPVTGALSAKVSFSADSASEGAAVPATAIVVHRVLPTTNPALQVQQKITADRNMDHLAEKLLVPTENVKEIGAGSNILSQFGASLQEKIDTENRSPKSPDTDQKSNPNNKSG